MKKTFLKNAPAIHPFECENQDKTSILFSIQAFHFISIIILVFMFGLPFSGFAQQFSYFDEPTPIEEPIQFPKREFRGVWVATVFNIDYPEKPTTNGIALQETWRDLLEDYQKLGLNAVIVQLRGVGDAIYPTELAPWSKYLTGKQGKAPKIVEDPLEKMIEIAHEMGFEFHAWFNPYRLTMNLDSTALAANHDFHRHRDWVVQYGNKFYLNPGLPEVQKHIVNIVDEVVKKYDIDAVHFDDYFYPYKIKDEEFPDDAAFEKYGTEFWDIGDWRRSNVDSLIYKLHTQIKAVKPYVRFGISPFGVWRNVADDPGGSLTRAGVTSYDHLYADILKWMREDWIDYVAPQIYWNIGFPPADYETLVDWWRDHRYNKQLYIGHAVYKVANNKEAAWSDPEELPRQIELNRTSEGVDGSIFFSSKRILSNPLGVKDTIQRYYYAAPALIPSSPNLDEKAIALPKLKKVKKRNGQTRLKWRNKWWNCKKNQATYYVIYRFDGDQVGDLNNPANILTRTAFNSKDKVFYDKTAKLDQFYTYVITAVNRQHEESEGSNARLVVRTPKKVKNLRFIPEKYFETTYPEDNY